MSRDTLTRILDLARWAPSGDNTQPWRFEIVDDSRVLVRGFDTRDHVLYDYEGHASHIAQGALLETMRIAATGFGLRAEWSTADGHDDRCPVYAVSFVAEPSAPQDELFPCIEKRTVQRRPMKTTPLTDSQAGALTAAAGPKFRTQLMASPKERRRVAALLWNSARIRLTCKEAYPVHKQIIEWHVRVSKDRIPEQAVGVDPATARLMEWVLQSWERVDFFNRYLMGTVMPRLQLDLLPGLMCGSHLLIRPLSTPTGLEDWVRLGVAVQRTWLTATHQGLHLQPQMTPLIFRWYARAGRSFSADPSMLSQATRLADDLERITGSTSSDPLGFFCRVGLSPVPESRSIRLDLPELMR